MSIQFLWPVLLALVLLSGHAFATPTIQHWTTVNGARVYFVAAHELPLVDIRLAFDAGSARDQDLPGLARFTNLMLQEGAGPHDADTVAERLAALGAELTTDSGRDMGWVSLRVLSDPVVRDPAVELLGLIAAQPALTAEALRRVRGQLLVKLRAEQQSPSDVASRAFYTHVFGDHPYALPPSGTEASISAIEVSDLKRFHQRYYVSRNAVVAIVGDLDRAQAELLATRAVAELPPGEPASALPAAPSVEASSERAIDFPSAQTHILVGQPAISRLHDDYYALYVGNHVLGGGGLVSLLFEEIRERRGLAYSVGSYVIPMRAEGPYIMGLQTQGEQAAEAVELMRGLLKEFVEKGPTAEQLQAAKKNITGGFPLRLDSNHKILGHVVTIGFYGLPLDHLDTFSARIDAVTVEDVRRVFARHIDPQRLVTVMVGPSGATSVPSSEAREVGIPANHGPSIPRDFIEQ